MPTTERRKRAAWRATYDDSLILLIHSGFSANTWCASALRDEATAGYTMLVMVLPWCTYRNKSMHSPGQFGLPTNKQIPQVFTNIAPTCKLKQFLKPYLLKMTRITWREWSSMPPVQWIFGNLKDPTTVPNFLQT